MIKTLFFASALSLAAIAACPAGAQPVAQAASESRSITVAKDKSMAFRLDAAVGELVVSQPDIAEIVAKTDHSFYIRGKKAGATNVLVYGPNQQLVEVIDVRVGPDTEALRQDLASSMPGEKIQVSNFADGVLLSGAVSTNSAATRAKQVALRYAPDAVSTNLTINDPQQVVLEVRIIEASRTALRDAGINLNVMGTNGSIVSGAGLLGITPAAGTFSVSGILNGVTIDATLQALEDKGIIKTLAKPNLVALSGEEASFLAGGEFPFPVPTQLNEVSIEFKPFGVSLKFTPQVQDNGSIRLKVEPEVSAIDNTQQLKINGFDVPSLTERKASTTVQLDSGKSFAIAGLFQQGDVNSIRQTPGLGDIPILGALFRSEQWNKQETELVIIVTPRLADVNAPLPDPFKEPIDLSRPLVSNPSIPTSAPAPSAPAAAQSPIAAQPAPPLAAAKPAPLAAPAPQAALAPAAPAPASLLRGPVPVETVLTPVTFANAPAPAAVRDQTVATADSSPNLARTSGSQNLDDLFQRLSQGPDTARPGA